MGRHSTALTFCLWCAVALCACGGSEPAPLLQPAAKVEVREDGPVLRGVTRSSIRPGRSGIAEDAVRADTHSSDESPIALPADLPWGRAKIILQKEIKERVAAGPGRRVHKTAFEILLTVGDGTVLVADGGRGSSTRLELRLEAAAGKATTRIEVVGNAWTRAFGCDGLPSWGAKGWSLATWSSALDTLLRLPEASGVAVGVRADDAVPAREVLVFLAAAQDARVKDLRIDVGAHQYIENAVDNPLQWLALHQLPDGSWNDRLALAYCEGLRMATVPLDASEIDADNTGLTGLVLLSFLGAGYTNRGRHLFAQVVARGLRYLKKRQDSDGGLSPEGAVQAHAWAALALMEAYGMTGSAIYKSAAQRGLSWLPAVWRDSKPDPLTTLLASMVLRSAQLINEDRKKREKKPTLEIDQNWLADLRAEVLVPPAADDDRASAARLLTRVMLNGRSAQPSEMAENALHLVRALSATGSNADPCQTWITALIIGNLRDDRALKPMKGFLKTHVLGSDHSDGHFCCLKGSADPGSGPGVERGRAAATAFLSLSLNLLWVHTHYIVRGEDR